MKLNGGVVWCLVLLCGCAYFAERPPRAEPHNPDIVQFRLVEDKESPDTVPMKMMGKDDTLHVSKQVLLNALDVESAKATRERHTGFASILLNFTRDGWKKFAEITEKNVGRRLAIVVNGQLVSAPVIRSRVAGGGAVITGGFTMMEARELANAINTNAAR